MLLARRLHDEGPGRVVDELAAAVDGRSQRYPDGVARRRVFPEDAAIAALGRSEELVPPEGLSETGTLRLPHWVGLPATLASVARRYFGFAHS